MEATSFFSLLGATPLPMLGRGQWLLIVLILGVVGVLWLTARRRNRNSPRESDRRRQRQAARLEHPTAVREIEEAMGELDALARDIHGRLDARFAQLDALIHSADERIDRMSRLLRQSETLPAIDVTVGKDEMPSLEEEATAAVEEISTGPTAFSPHEPVYVQADAGLSSLQIAEKLGRTSGEIELILALRKTREQAERQVAAQTAS